MENKPKSIEFYKQFLPKHDKMIEILHFNDVYNLEEQTTNSGQIKSMARFATAFEQYRSIEKLTLFSGDLFYPSNLSTFYDGEQMVFPFNSLSVDISCLGNHEFDQGIAHAKKLIAQTNCPWIISNLVDLENRPIADVPPFHVLEHNNTKIGFLGFAEEAWLD